jgi:DNA-binding MarR family transcriptional regulator
VLGRRDEPLPADRVPRGDAHHNHRLANPLLIHVRKQTMAQAVEQLELAGYVERKPNPNDRRSQLVFLTERGKSVPPVTHAAAARVEERWAALTSPKELEALRKSLVGLLDALQAGSS